MKKKLLIILSIACIVVIAGVIWYTNLRYKDTVDNPYIKELNKEPNLKSELDEDKDIKELILTYLLNEYSDAHKRIYFYDDEPDILQEGDYRIDSIVYVGERPTYEAVGVAYKVNFSQYYFTRNEKSEKIYSWHKFDPYYIVLRRNGYDGTWVDVYGQTNTIAPNKCIEDIILEVVYHLQDIEVSLRLDGYPQLVGPFSAPNFFNEESKSKILKDWEPIYGDGDYWMQYYYNNLVATCYYNAKDEQTKVNRIETTRTDISTHRGIRIGATRGEVLKEYSNIYNVSYWDYQGDYLWYCNNGGGFGAALIFYFENDIVVKIELNTIID